MRQHKDQASLADAATTKQSAWSESRADLAITTMGQQNNEASLFDAASKHGVRAGHTWPSYPWATGPPDKSV